MNVLFVIDKLEFKYFEFNDLVTNFWIIKELLEKGDTVYITTINGLYLQRNRAYTRAYQAYVKDNNIFYNKNVSNLLIEDFDLVVFRPDPPVDNDYLNATYILDFVKNTKIINNPTSIRNFNEKIHTALFTEFMPDFIVSSNRLKIEDFLNECGEIVLKPLNQCFGSGVMYLHSGDYNTRSIINAVTNNEQSLVMVQKFIPDIKYGDKRVLTLGDEVLDECIVKLPTNDDFKFNTHSDQYIRKGILTQTEKKNYKYIAETLNKIGISMAGLDVVNEQILEINITSPCYFIKEINNNFGIHMEKTICDYIHQDSHLYIKTKPFIDDVFNNDVVEHTLEESYKYKTETV